MKSLMLFAALTSAALMACRHDTLPEWIDMPEVRGQVVAKDTGLPVAGAEVFILWVERDTNFDLLAPSRSGHADTRWTTTDPEGRFVIPAHRWKVYKRLRRDSKLNGPHAWVVHREYLGGITDEPWPTETDFDPDDPGGWTTSRVGVLRVGRALPIEVEDMKSAERTMGVGFCSQLAWGAAQEHCCIVLNGDPDACCKAVYGLKGIGPECRGPEPFRRDPFGE